MSTIWKVILTVIITAAVIGGGGYYYLNQKATGDKADLQSQIDALNKQLSEVETADSSSTSVATDETVDWKTYLNSKFKFSIKYPETFSAENASSYSDNDGVFIYSSSTLTPPSFVSVEARESSLSLDDFIKNETADKTFSGVVKISVDSQPAYEGVDAGLINSYGIIAKNNSVIYKFVFNTGNLDGLTNNKAALTAVQKQILSTFKFSK